MSLFRSVHYRRFHCTPLVETPPPPPKTQYICMYMLMHICMYIDTHLALLSFYANIFRPSLSLFQQFLNKCLHEYVRTYVCIYIHTHVHCMLVAPPFTVLHTYVPCPIQLWYVSVALNKTYSVAWIQQVKTLLLRACVYLKGLQVCV